MYLGGASWFFGGPLAPASDPALAYGVCNDDLTGRAGLGVVARLARFRGLPEQLAASVRLQRRRRGGSTGQRLLALRYSACAGGGHLHAGDALGADAVARRACGRRWGYVPVFVDGPGIEVEGQLFENGEPGYHGEQQSWLPSVCGGAAGVSARLHAGGTDVQGDGREQLDRDAAPWLTGRQPVGRRAASADSCQDLVSSCRRKGWDDSGSVTDPRQKAPTLRLAAAMGLREDEGEPLDAAGKEWALAVAYRPARGPEEPVCGVLRRDGDGEQRLPEPVCTVIPVSRDRLPVAELGRRHRGQQGQENAFQGPLPDLGWHHPPYRSHAAQQGFHLGGQIAQLLLRQRPDQVPPSEARQPELQPLIRYCVGSVGRLTHSARRLGSRSNLRLDWGGAAGAAPGPAAGDRRGAREGLGAPGAGGAAAAGRGQAGAGHLRGAQVARRQDEGPAPGTPGSPLKPYGPAIPISENYPGDLGSPDLPLDSRQEYTGSLLFERRLAPVPGAFCKDRKAASRLSRSCAFVLLRPRLTCHLTKVHSSSTGLASRSAENRALLRLGSQPSVPGLSTHGASYNCQPLPASSDLLQKLSKDLRRGRAFPHTVLKLALWAAGRQPMEAQTPAATRPGRGSARDCPRGVRTRSAQPGRTRRRRLAGLPTLGTGERA